MWQLIDLGLQANLKSVFSYYDKQKKKKKKKYHLSFKKLWFVQHFQKKSLYPFINLFTVYLATLATYILISKSKFLANTRNEQTNAEFPIRKLWFFLQLQTHSLLPFIVYLHSYLDVIIALNVSLPTSQAVQYCFPHLLRAWI